jgi:hypothetical protein
LLAIDWRRRNKGVHPRGISNASKVKKRRMSHMACRKARTHKAWR